MKGRKKVFVSIILMVVIVGGFFYAQQNMPVKKVLKAIQNKNFTYAVEVYEKNIQNNSKQEALFEDELKKILEEKKKGFINEKILYEEVREFLKIVKMFDIENVNLICENILEYVDKIDLSRKFYREAEEKFLEENYADAIKKYDKVDLEDSYYEKAKERQEEAIRLYKEKILSESEKNVQKEDYESALIIIENALELLSDDAELIEKRNLYESRHKEKIVQETLSVAEAAYQQQDYETALKALETGRKKYKAEELEQKFNQYYKEYLENVISEAEEIFAESGHQKAIDKLNEYYHIFKSEEQYLAVMNEYKALIPDKLSTLNIFEKNDNVKYDGCVKDRLENEYTDAFRLISKRWDTDGWFEYYINGKYTKMNGTIAHYYYTGDYVSNGEICLEIYADNNLVYTSEWITTKTQPIEFSVDLTGVSYIKFKCVEKETSINVTGPALILDSVELEKY